MGPQTLAFQFLAERMPQPMNRVTMFSPFLNPRLTDSGWKGEFSSFSAMMTLIRFTGLPTVPM